MGSGNACLINMGGVFAYTVINNFGTYDYGSIYDTMDTDYVDFSSSYCDCATMDSIYSGCNYIDLMPAWVFFKGDYYYSIFNFTLWAYIQNFTQPEGVAYVSKCAFDAVAMSVYCYEFSFEFTEGGYANAHDKMCNNCSTFALNAYGKCWICAIIGSTFTLR